MTPMSSMYSTWSMSAAVPMVNQAQEAILTGSLLVALPIAVLAGLLSFFTPCSLPLVPGYLSYVAGMAGQDSPVTRELRGESVRRARVVAGAVLFVLGFALVFTAYGALFGSVGSALVAQQGLIMRVAGVLTIALGLLFAGAADRIPVLRATARPSLRPRVGLGGAPILGALFAVGWTPCIGPALAAVLTLSTTSSTAARGAVLSMGYALGLGVPFVLAALSITRAMRVFAWARRRTVLLTRLGGAMLVVVGLLQVSGVWSELVARLQVVVAGWQAPL
jgi:cytochrome c-type biogenesis protein